MKQRTSCLPLCSHHCGLHSKRSLLERRGLECDNHVQGHNYRHRRVTRKSICPLFLCSSSFLQVSSVIWTISLPESLPPPPFFFFSDPQNWEQVCSPKKRVWGLQPWKVLLRCLFLDGGSPSLCSTHLHRKPGGHGAEHRHTRAEGTPFFLQLSFHPTSHSLPPVSELFYMIFCLLLSVSLLLTRSLMLYSLGSFPNISSSQLSPLWLSLGLS